MTTLKITLIGLACLFCGAGLQAQPSSESLKSKWLEPEALGPNINSAYNEIFPMISPDGLNLYFASNRPGGLSDFGAAGFEALDIYISSRKTIDAPWTKPVHPGAPINTPYADHSVAFSAGGHWMYFASTRPSPDGCGEHDLYRSYREDTGDELGWEQPQNLGCKVNSPADDSCPFLVADDTTGQTLLYFVSKRTGGPGSWDVYVSHLDEETNTFGRATLVPTLNSTAFDGHLDAEHGILWSGNKKGYGGGDLWFVFKDDEGHWKAPVNMGPPVNTKNNEGCFTLTEYGSTLFFTSDRPGGKGGYDLYMSSKRKLENK